MLWLALILPELPLQAHIRGHEAQEKLVITDKHPRPHVVAASPYARAHGIQIGQSVASALMMAPDLRLVKRAPDEEASLLKELAAWASAFSPCVCLDPPDGIVLEVSSCLRLFGGMDALKASLLDGVRRQGLTVAIAHAPTPLAARWFAGEEGCNPALPTGLSLSWKQRLDALPLNCLTDGSDISQSHLDLLSGLGLQSLGEVRALPVSGLARRQSKSVIDTLARAYGEHHDLRQAYATPANYSAHINLATPTINTEPLMFGTRRLLAGLASWLAVRHAGIDHYQLTLMHERGPATLLNILTGVPSRNEARLNMLAREHLAVLKLRAPAEGIKLSTHAPCALAARSDDLFGDATSDRENALLLLDRLRARLGEDRVKQIAPFPDWRPERACHPIAPLTAHKTRNATTSAATGMCRPLWLREAPQRIDRPCQIKLLRGPERIEQGWWDGHDVRRDYYLARHENGALWWVYRELTPPGDWYVHGYFA